jgi:hypothetical protein
MTIKIKCNPGENFVELTYEQIEKIYYDLQERMLKPDILNGKDPVEYLKGIFGMKD